MFTSSKKKKKAAAEAAAEQEEAPPTFVVMIQVEKDLLVGAKKTISVPVTIPAMPDLELSWEVSVRRANIGISAAFMPDVAVEECDDGATSSPSRVGTSMDGLASVDEGAAAAGATTVATASMPVGGEQKRRFFRFRRQASRANSEDLDDDDESGSFPLPAKIKLPEGAVPVMNYERISRGEVLDGDFRFDGTGGRVVFILDNSYSKTRRKRVMIKLVVESINTEADAAQEQAEMAAICQLRAKTLLMVPDPSGYLETDMNVKRFLDARPTFDEALAMLTNTLRWRNEGRFFLPGGCPGCLALPGRHVWRQIGFDNERRPVVYFSLAQTLPKVRNSFKPFETVCHIIELLEQGHKTMEPDAAFGFTWVLDLQVNLPKSKTGSWHAAPLHSMSNSHFFPRA